ncbi:MAG: 2-amino-4-hydroxy-6-hydroxymethyldihydropteridine diphosphokinase [Bacteroidia bacterium]
MNEAYLILGTNVGNQLNNIELALKLLELQIGVIKKKSAVYSTKAWGYEDQPDFLNQAILIETLFDASTLLNKLLDIEKQLGRVRKVNEVWMQRTMDIDILFFNTEIINLANLTIPHPHLQNRKFVLTPLIDIASNYIHPQLNKSIQTLIEECTDKLAVKLI